MLKKEVVICGAGGHGKVVADILMKSGWRVRGFLDDAGEGKTRNVLGIPVIGDIETGLTAMLDSCEVVVAIGSNAAREKVVAAASARGAVFATAIHPAAQIGEGVHLGPGTVVMATGVINADSWIGAHVIINTSATIDHDCRVGDFAHISPGVNLAGGVHVGRGAHVGIGACVIPGIKIGQRAVVGAGAVVIRDVPPGMTVVGNPAAPIRDGANKQ